MRSSNDRIPKKPARQKKRPRLSAGLSTGPAITDHPGITDHDDGSKPDDGGDSNFALLRRDILSERRPNMSDAESEDLFLRWDRQRKFVPNDDPIDEERDPTFRCYHTDTDSEYDASGTDTESDEEPLDDDHGMVDDHVWIGLFDPRFDTIKRFGKYVRLDEDTDIFHLAQCHRAGSFAELDHRDDEGQPLYGFVEKPTLMVRRDLDDDGISDMRDIHNDCYNNNHILNYEGRWVNGKTGKPLGRRAARANDDFYKQHRNAPVIARGCRFVKGLFKPKGCHYLVGYGSCFYRFKSKRDGSNTRWRRCGAADHVCSLAKLFTRAKPGPGDKVYSHFCPKLGLAHQSCATKSFVPRDMLDASVLSVPVYLRGQGQINMGGDSKGPHRDASRAYVRKCNSNQYPYKCRVLPGFSNRFNLDCLETELEITIRGDCGIYSPYIANAVQWHEVMPNPDADAPSFSVCVFEKKTDVSDAVRIAQFQKEGYEDVRPSLQPKPGVGIPKNKLGFWAKLNTTAKPSSKLNMSDNDSSDSESDLESGQLRESDSESDLESGQVLSNAEQLRESDSESDLESGQVLSNAEPEPEQVQESEPEGGVVPIPGQSQGMKRGASKLYGVCKYGNGPGWVAKIRRSSILYDGERVYLGLFNKEEDAAKCVDDYIYKECPLMVNKVNFPRDEECPDDEVNDRGRRLHTNRFYGVVPYRDGRFAAQFWTCKRSGYSGGKVYLGLFDLEEHAAEAVDDCIYEEFPDMVNKVNFRRH